jgi:enterochelin esterase-like enzyme
MDRFAPRLSRPARHSRLPQGFRQVRWPSQALRKEMAFFIYLPTEYHLEARRWPVLYLLHGSGHDRHSVLSEVCPHHQMGLLGDAILIIPDGDQGWWLDSPRVHDSQYGKYVLELVDLVDSNFRTAASRAGRGICGFSMGGFGAMWLASQHAERFGSASSLLGPLDIGHMFPDYYRLKLLLGSDLDVWQRHNPICQAAELGNTALKFCTAEGAFDRPQNAAFASALDSLCIPFEYAVYPGQHDTAFVRQHISEHFVFHRHSFGQGG